MTRLKLAGSKMDVNSVNLSLQNAGMLVNKTFSVSSQGCANGQQCTVVASACLACNIQDTLLSMVQDACLVTKLHHRPSVFGLLC